MENEEWRDIEGYEGLYQISNLGRVKSLGNTMLRKEKILKPNKHNCGYYRVELSKNNKQKWYYIHRLVAQAFIPNPDDLLFINHKDEDKTNNAVGNLEYCTARYNCNYGTHNERIAKALSKKVLCVETGVIYQSTQEIQRKIGLPQSNICLCCNGKQKTCGGYHWKYID